MLVVICFVGSCITWPVLFPVNATGGGGGQELDLLAFTNIDTDTSSGKNRFYAHVFIGWLFYSFVLLLVCRETIFYINLRQAFLLSPLYANRISSRTVLFTSVPEPYLNEPILRKVFGASVKNIWITGDTTKLDELVEKRDKIAYNLESAEVKLIKLANKARLEAQKKGAPAEEAPVVDGDTESGSIAARWIPHSKRPTHKLGKFGLYGQKVDSINWSREQLQTLIPEIEAAQAEYREGANKPIPAVFIEFKTQSDAQAAFQTLSHHQALHMSPRYIGVQPGEIVWKSLRISWWQKVVRRYAVLAFITALIVFWAIPVAFVGLVSNVNYLETYSFLAWLKSVPNIIMGVITGLLPSVLLAILMSLVPVIMRCKLCNYLTFRNADNI
jgi:calcium permeable stress-gated cation channel